MILADLPQFNLPDEPGVYFFKKGRETLYIGKATSLKSRVRSYFAADLITTRGESIVKMVAESDGLEFQTTDSVLEALILEAVLIRNFKPPYNVRQKDDKSYWYVVITKEDFPRVLMVREKELSSEIDPGAIKYYFGPFPYATELRAALKIIRKILPYRDKCEVPSVKPCFDSQIGLCPGVCAGTITKSEYGRYIRHLVLFFEGKKKKLISLLEKEMKIAVKHQDFEAAARARDQLFALTHINDIAMIKENRATRGLRIESFDVAHISGKETVGVMTVILGGVPEKGAYRKFIIRGKGALGPNDPASLTELVHRRLNHTEWPLPVLIVVDGGKIQVNAVSRELESAGLVIPIVGVVKDERHRPREIIGDKRSARDHESEILLANAEAHRFAIAFHRNRRGRL